MSFALCLLMLLVSEQSPSATVLSGRLRLQQWRVPAKTISKNAGTPSRGDSLFVWAKDTLVVENA
jgi:hypothetical protein